MRRTKRVTQAPADQPSLSSPQGGSADDSNSDLSSLLSLLQQLKTMGPMADQEQSKADLMATQAQSEQMANQYQPAMMQAKMKEMAASGAGGLGRNFIGLPPEDSLEALKNLYSNYGVMSPDQFPVRQHITFNPARKNAFEQARAQQYSTTPSPVTTYGHK